MAGRYSGPVRFFYLGDESVARQYNGIARKLVAYLQNQSELVRDNLWTASRKVRISDGVIIEVRKVTDLIYNAYIDARGVIAESPIIKAIQYQFVYTGGAGQQWQVFTESDKPVLSGGSAVGVIFLIREDRVDHVAVPLVSTLLEPPDDEWVFVPTLALGDTGAWTSALLVPRYEIAHASSQHLAQPTEFDMVYSAWMPKGVRHYMAQAFTVATLRENGALTRRINVATAPAMDTLSFNSSSRQQVRGTDVGYETSLADSTPPTGSLSEFRLGPKKVSVEFSAPDADWYTSYGVQTAVTPAGVERRYGVFVDAAQTLYVWPLDAAGTGAPNPAYAAQVIKTNVDSMYVRTQALVFPAEVYSEALSFRDSFTSFGDVNAYANGPYEYATRYVWTPRFDGARFATIVERLQDPPDVVNMFLPEQDYGFPPYYYGIWDEPKTYQLSDPVVAEFSLSVTPTGENLEDFTIEVGPMELIEGGEHFTPIQVGYAAEQSFTDASQGDLLIAGFEVRRLSEDIDSWVYTDIFNNPETPVSSGTPLYAKQYFNCQVMRAPAPLPPRISGIQWYVDPGSNPPGTHEGNVPRNVNFMYYHLMPEYMQQDMPFHCSDAIPDVSVSVGGIPQAWPKKTTELKKSWTFEGYIKVKARDGTEVFTACCRKYEPNEKGFPNFFTAQIADLDVSTGTMAFGLCSSTTWVSGVDGAAPQYAGGPIGDLTGQEAENNSQKGYAMYHHGNRIAVSDAALANKLDIVLTSSLLSKEYKNWGALRAAPQISVIPALAQQIQHLTATLNTSYAAAVAAQGQLNALVFGDLGMFDFPWGLEMYAWFAHNHYARREYLSSVIAGSEICTFTGAYLDIKTPVVLDVETHNIKNEVTVGLEHVDILYVADTPFSHADLYEEAFGQPASLAYDLRAEAVPVRHPSQGYPIRFTTATTESDPASYIQRDVFAPIVIAQDSAGVDIYGENLLCPEARVYCDLTGFTNRFDPAEEATLSTDDPEDPAPPDSATIRARQGVIKSPFVAKCFSQVELEE